MRNRETYYSIHTLPNPYSTKELSNSAATSLNNQIGCIKEYRRAQGIQTTLSMCVDTSRSFQACRWFSKDAGYPEHQRDDTGRSTTSLSVPQLAPIGKLHPGRDVPLSRGTKHFVHAFPSNIFSIYLQGFLPLNFGATLGHVHSVSPSTLVALIVIETYASLGFGRDDATRRGHYSPPRNENTRPS